MSVGVLVGPSVCHKFLMSRKSMLDSMVDMRVKAFRYSTACLAISLVSCVREA